jgi:hypothetical protein
MSDILFVITCIALSPIYAVGFVCGMVRLFFLEGFTAATTWVRKESKV